VSDADPCLYVRQKQDRKLIVVVYVDDGIIAATHLEDCHEFLTV